MKNLQILYCSCNNCKFCKERDYTNISNNNNNNIIWCKNKYNCNTCKQCENAFLFALYEVEGNVNGSFRIIDGFTCFIFSEYWSHSHSRPIASLSMNKKPIKLPQEYELILLSGNPDKCIGIRDCNNAVLQNSFKKFINKIEFN